MMYTTKDLHDLIEELLKSIDDHQTEASYLFEKTKGQIFPCDLLVLSGVTRSASLTKAFCLFMKNKGYISAAHLLRFQLDTILRLYAVIDHVDDSHAVAWRVIEGEKFSKIKDKKGKYLKDHRLVELLEPQNPKIRNAYDLCSGFIHFSQRHVKDFMGQSEPSPDGGFLFSINTEDDYVPLDHKMDLTKTFANVTRNITSIARQWADVRLQRNNINELKQQYGLYGPHRNPFV